ncbi:hypothetical protein D3C71_1330450 [compost metagenome]
MAHGQWLAGFDREFPQQRLAALAQYLAEAVGVTGGHAARAEHQVRRVLQLFELESRLAWLVGENAGLDDLATQRIQPMAQQCAVAVVDAAGLERCARIDQFIAGGQQRHPWSPHDLHMGAALRCRDRQFERTETLAGAQQHIADAVLLTLRADVAAGAQWLLEADTSVIQYLRVLLHLHAVGTRRNRGAGEDARAGSRCQGFGGVTGKYLLRHGQRCPVPTVDIQGIAVHGAVRPRRQIEGRHQVIGQHPLPCGTERHRFTVFNPLCLGHCQQPFDGILHRHQG